MRFLGVFIALMLGICAQTAGAQTLGRAYPHNKTASETVADISGSTLVPRNISVTALSVSTTDASRALTVGGSISATGLNTFGTMTVTAGSSTGNTNIDSPAGTVRLTTGGTVRVIVNSNGVSIGKGTSAGTAALTVSGSVALETIANSAGTNALCWNSVGGVVTYSTACTVSDARLKKDIQVLTEPLDGILKLKPVRYHWADPLRDSSWNMGLLAQDVINVYPEAVTLNDDGLYSLQYTALVAPLIGAVQELAKRVQQLEAAEVRRGLEP